MEIEQQAAQLLPNDREKLAEFLLESLQGPVNAYENGEVSTISAEVVFAEANWTNIRADFERS